jgi:hypothetical protein
MGTLKTGKIDLNDVQVVRRLLDGLQSLLRTSSSYYDLNLNRNTTLRPLASALRRRPVGT